MSYIICLVLKMFSLRLLYILADKFLQGSVLKAEDKQFFVLHQDLEKVNFSTYTHQLQIRQEKRNGKLAVRD